MTKCLLRNSLCLSTSGNKLRSKTPRSELELHKRERRSSDCSSYEGIKYFKILGGGGVFPGVSGNLPFPVNIG